MPDFSERVCSLRKSSEEGTLLKSDLEKIAKNLGIEHKKKINKTELCGLVYNALKRIGQLSNWKAYISSKPSRKSSPNISPYNSSRRGSPIRSGVSRSPMSTPLNSPRRSSPHISPRYSSRSPMSTPLHSSRRGSHPPRHSSPIRSHISSAHLRPPTPKVKKPRKGASSLGSDPILDKFSQTKCTRGALLEYKLEEIRRLAGNMNIPIHRLSPKTNRPVYMPKKELCTAIKTKFKEHYERDEKYHWQDIKDGTRKPRRKSPDSRGNYYSNLMIKDVPRRKAPQVKQPKSPKAPKPKAIKKMTFKQFPISDQPDMVRSSYSNFNRDQQLEGNRLKKLQNTAIKLGINTRNKDGTERSPEKLEYNIKNKYNELTALLHGMQED